MKEMCARKGTIPASFTSEASCPWIEKPLLSTVPRQDEFASMNAIATVGLSPALLIELRKVMTVRRKKSVMPAGRSVTSPAGGTIPFERSYVQLADKRLANLLASSGDSYKPTTGAQRRALVLRPCPCL